MVLEGLIQCDGKKGGLITDSPYAIYGGGGSGGTVKILSTNFMGSGNISALGGDSSEDGSAGEGAGGIIDIKIINMN